MMRVEGQQRGTRTVIALFGLVVGLAAQCAAQTAYRLDDLFYRVTGNVVTPHVRWAKPYERGKIKALIESGHAEQKFAPTFDDLFDQIEKTQAQLRTPRQESGFPDMTDEEKLLELLNDLSEKEWDLKFQGR